MYSLQYSDKYDRGEFIALDHHLMSSDAYKLELGSCNGGARLSISGLGV